MLPSQQTMLFWLATAAVEARGDRSVEEIAALANVSVNSLRAFERGNSWPQANRLDRVLAAYAGDGRVLWSRALELWTERGEATELA